MTTPRGKVHRFDFTAGGRAKDYTPASSDAKYARAYSSDRALERVGLPSGAAQVMGYDAAGRLTSEHHVQSKRSFAYDGEQDRFGKVTRELADGSDKQTWTSAYDGLLPEVDGVRRRGRRALRVHARRPRAADVGEAHGGRHDVHARAGVRQGPDGDQDRAVHDRASGPGGAVSKIADDKLSLAYTYDANGRPVGRTLTVGGTERFYQKLTFDTVGRAGAREERVAGGALDSLTYGYDGIGPAADRQARRDRAREPHVRPRRQPGVRRRGRTTTRTA